MDDARDPSTPMAPALRGFSLAATSVEWAPGEVPMETPPIALALGMFDGVHRGHQAVLDSAATTAGCHEGGVGVFTFRPHPSRILRPDQATEMLFHDGIKARRLFQHGVQVILWKTFDRHFSTLGAVEFAQMLRDGIPSLRSVHVGKNFRFGHDRLGTPELLAQNLGEAGISVISVPQVVWNGDTISSTRVRAALRAGEIRNVNTMLGDFYSCSGQIVGGKRLGRSIGYPTLNLVYDPECRPRFGVYIVQVTGADGVVVPAIANYGLRPTVEDTVEPRLELHALGTPPLTWQAGVLLSVEWLDFLRPEERFADLEMLKRQIGRDVAEARAWFAAANGLD